MRSFNLIAVAALTVGLFVSPALAFQCPTLIKKINDATATRYDPAAASAKEMAGEAAALHAAGKHDDSVKKANEALKVLGMM